MSDQEWAERQAQTDFRNNPSTQNVQPHQTNSWQVAQDYNNALERQRRQEREKAEEDRRRQEEELRRRNSGH